MRKKKATIRNKSEAESPAEDLDTQNKALKKILRALDKKGKTTK